ncbi:hypothetical protein F4778DRAFT_796191 [Xylariomycetidae sp. FL2044]|nr:hypothetical protein F4778DRAFT_796191 [Xylariomycetidae sp. FL2044]
MSSSQQPYQYYQAQPQFQAQAPAAAEPFTVETEPPGKNKLYIVAQDRPNISPGEPPHHWALLSTDATDPPTGHTTQGMYYNAENVNRQVSRHGWIYKERSAWEPAANKHLLVLCELPLAPELSVDQVRSHIHHHGTAVMNEIKSVSRRSGGFDCKVWAEDVVRRLHQESGIIHPEATAKEMMAAATSAAFRYQANKGKPGFYNTLKFTWG